MPKALEKIEHKHSFVFYKKTAKLTYYKCAAPTCMYYIDKELLLGKESLCPACNSETFILTKEALKRKRPLCFNCADSKDARTHRAARALISMLGADTEGEETLETDAEGKEEEETQSA